MRPPEALPTYEAGPLTGPARAGAAARDPAEPASDRLDPASRVGRADLEDVPEEHDSA